MLARYKHRPRLATEEGVVEHGISPMIVRGYEMLSCLCMSHMTRFSAEIFY